MRYVAESDKFQVIGQTMFQVHGAAVQGKGSLRIWLRDGSHVEGRFYGIHCTPNSTQHIACAVDLGHEDDDYVSVVDLLEIERVEGANLNGGM